MVTKCKWCRKYLILIFTWIHIIQLVWRMWSNVLWIQPFEDTDIATLLAEQGQYKIKLHIDIFPAVQWIYWRTIVQAQTKSCSGFHCPQRYCNSIAQYLSLTLEWWVMGWRALAYLWAVPEKTYLGGVACRRKLKTPLSEVLLLIPRHTPTAIHSLEQHNHHQLTAEEQSLKRKGYVASSCRSTHPSVSLSPSFFLAPSLCTHTHTHAPTHHLWPWKALQSSTEGYQGLINGGCSYVLWQDIIGL